MKTIIKMLCLISLASFWNLNTLADVTDVYEFRMRLKIPRVYNNTTSQGYRKYQTQIIKGLMYVDYIDDELIPEIRFVGLINKKHKVAGSYVKYNAKALNTDTFMIRWNYIGDNKRDRFRTPSVCFYMTAEPSYNIGNPDEPDNSLYLVLSGTGKVKAIGNRQYVPSKVSGYVAGTIGCGCSAYGHISPTRFIGPYGRQQYETDVGGVHGRWSIKLKQNERVVYTIIR